MKKAMAKLIVAAAAVAMLALPAFAGGPNNNGGESIQPRGALCDECHRGEMQKISTTDTGWVTITYVPCVEDDITHTDKYQERTIRHGYRCTYCGVGTETETTYERYICQ